MQNYIDKIKTMKGKEYFYTLLSYSLAPTLDNLKSGTLLNFSKGNKNQLYSWLNYREEILNTFELKGLQLTVKEDCITELFYKEHLLENSLKRTGYIEFLNKLGYCEGFCNEDYLKQLKLRFEKSFPHEIGIFLDIPLWDIVDYIKYQGRNYIFCGYWKVYSNPNYALETFESYNTSKLKALHNLYFSGCSRF